jgi:proline dehydrogenase
VTRDLFLYLSRQKAIRRWMETSAAARRLTQRFIAGETLEQELAVCGELQAKGILSTLDHLGENVASLDEAAVSRDAYLAALDEIRARKLAATISIKLTQMGLDFSTEACLENVRALASRASQGGTRVEIDMESTAYTDRTLRIVERVAGDCGCVRAVIQAYLYRSEADIKRMNRLRIPVRLCKGAYLESHTVAYPRKKDVDANYIKLMKMLLDEGADPALATHDESIQSEARRYVRERGIAAANFEFEMLYGIRRDLQRSLNSDGFRLRLYVPYGTAWYPYFMRRLAERPANAFFLLRNLFR